MTKRNKGEEIAYHIWIHICQYLHCDTRDICAIILEKKEEAFNF